MPQNQQVQHRSVNNHRALCKTDRERKMTESEDKEIQRVITKWMP